MSRAQGVYDFGDHVQGASLPGATFQTYINDAAPPVELADVSMILAKDGVTTLTPEVSIADPVNWIIAMAEVSPAAMNIEEGIHEGDIMTTDANGTVTKFTKILINILPSPQ